MRGKTAEERRKRAAARYMLRAGAARVFTSLFHAARRAAKDDFGACFPSKPYAYAKRCSASTPRRRRTSIRFSRICRAAARACPINVPGAQVRHMVKCLPYPRYMPRALPRRTLQYYKICACRATALLMPIVAGTPRIRAPRLRRLRIYGRQVHCGCRRAAALPALHALCHVDASKISRTLLLRSTVRRAIVLCHAQPCHAACYHAVIQDIDMSPRARSKRAEQSAVENERAV